MTRKERQLRFTQAAENVVESLNGLLADEYAERTAKRGFLTTGETYQRKQERVLLLRALDCVFQAFGEKAPL